MTYFYKLILILNPNHCSPLLRHLPTPILKSISINQIIHPPRHPPLHRQKWSLLALPHHHSNVPYTTHMHRVQSRSQIQIIQSKRFEALSPVPTQERQSPGLEGVSEEGEGEDGKETSRN